MPITHPVGITVTLANTQKDTKMFTITSHVATLPPKERLKIINLLLQELEPEHLDKAYNSRLSDLENTIPRKKLNKILKSANQN